MPKVGITTLYTTTKNKTALRKSLGIIHPLSLPAQNFAEKKNKTQTFSNFWTSNASNARRSTPETDIERDKASLARARARRQHITPVHLNLNDCRSETEIKTTRTSKWDKTFASFELSLILQRHKLRLQLLKMHFST